MDRREFLKSLTLACAGISMQRMLFASNTAEKHRITYEKNITSLKEAMFYKKLSRKQIQCTTCFRMCVVSPGKRGYCRVRENIDGTYYSLVYSKPAAVHIDPIEKEPAYHMLPGSDILCFGTAGCNFQCRHCHNWHLSQAMPEDLHFYAIAPH